MTWQARIQPLANEVLATRHISGMVVGRAQGNGPLEVLALGDDAVGRPLRADSLFPVASVTKLATALAVLRLAAQGLDLDAPLTGVLPDAAAARPGVTLRTLLCHTAGLPDDVAPAAAPYAPGLDWPVLAQACLSTPLVKPPHTRVHYSNVGPGLLAIVVERLTGLAFGPALTQLVLAPLGIDGYLGVEPPQQPAMRERWVGTTCRHRIGAVQLAILAQPGVAVGRSGDECGGRHPPGASFRRRAGWLLAGRNPHGRDAQSDRRPGRRAVSATALAGLPVGSRSRTARRQDTPLDLRRGLARLLWSRRRQRHAGLV